MTADKRIYPGTGTSLAASEYKTRLQHDFHVSGIVTNATGNLSLNAHMYDEMTKTVNAIERGQSHDSYYAANFLSGMNCPSENLRKASVELLELCRQQLLEIEEHYRREIEKINRKNYPNLDAQEIKDLQNKQKEEQEKARNKIFEILKDIRNANAKERTWAWSRTFAYSLARQLGNVFTKKNIAMALFAVGVCFTVKALMAASLLGFLGPAAPCALFFVVGVICVVALFKMALGAYKAGQEANAAVSKDKKQAAGKVLGRIADFKEDIAKEAESKMKAAEALMNSAIQARDSAVAQHQTAATKPLEEQIVSLNERMETYKERYNELQTIVNSKDANVTTKAKREASDEMKTIESAYPKLRAQLTTVSSTLQSAKTSLPSNAAALEKDVKDKTAEYKKKKDDYNALNSAAQKQRDIAKPETASTQPKPFTPRFR